VDKNREVVWPVDASHIRAVDQIPAGVHTALGRAPAPAVEYPRHGLRHREADRQTQVAPSASADHPNLPIARRLGVCPVSCLTRSLAAWASPSCCFGRIKRRGGATPHRAINIVGERLRLLFVAVEESIAVGAASGEWR